MPGFLRAAVAFLVVYFGAKVIVGATATAASFYPAEIGAVFSLVVFALALPGPAQPPRALMRAVEEA